MSIPSHIPLSSLGEPFYTGSVQRLYAISGCDTHMVTETTSRGSVFDVGSIFAVEGSDLARAVFRHALFSLLANPDGWSQVRTAIEADPAIPSSLRLALLAGPLEQLCQHGAQTHHEGMIDSLSGEIITSGLPRHPSPFNVVRRFHILKPTPLEILGQHLYDYSAFSRTDGFVVPLEYIVRFGVTPASSIFRKYLKLSPAEQTAYARSLGAGDSLRPWARLPAPLADCTTKFEPEDRNLSRQEALTLCSLPGPLFTHTLKLAVLGAWAVRLLLDQIGLLLWDIKWEFATSHGQTIFVDTIDTDSFRATRFLDTDRGRCVIHFNKQSIRDYYALLHPDWIDGINAAKEHARASGVPFAELLSQGQNRGLYPPTPSLDPDFLVLQSSKLRLIQQFLLGESPPPEVSRQLADIAAAEYAFYQSRGLDEPFHLRNGI